MGRPEERNVAEDSRKISIFWLKQKGFLTGYRSGNISWTWGGDPSTRSSISITVNTDQGYIELDYTQTDYWSDEKRSLNYRHGLIATPCNFGGMRYWFECKLTRNGRYCGRRVGVLYKSAGTWYWGCRHCHHIGYNSQRTNLSNPLYAVLDLGIKADELEPLIKRRFWRGKPTRKYRKLLKIYRRMGSHNDFFKNL